MNPWPWISSLGRASIEGGLLILGVWAVCRSWRSLPAWARSGLWWLASARLLVALAPWSAISVPTPVPIVATWWPEAIASPPAGSLPASRPLVSRQSEAPSSGLAAPVSLVRPAPMRRPSFELRRLDARSLGLTILLVWAAGVLLRLIGMARQFARVRRMRRAAAPAGTDVPASLVDAPGVRIALHDEVTAPMVTGMWRPLVLLPAGMVARPGDDLRLAVAHELSHVRRGDLWLAWIPALAEALFWFHPLVSICAREYVQACEEACDEDALRATGAHPYEYGRLLLALGVDRRWTGAGAVAFGSPNPRQLVRRLSMLKQVAPRSPRVRTAALSLVCAFALVGLAPIRVVPASGAPRVARLAAPRVAAEEAPAAAERAPEIAGTLAPAAATSQASSAAASVATGVSPSPADATSPVMNEDPPPPPDDPEVTPSPDDDGGDLDRTPDVDDGDSADDPDSDEDVTPAPPQAPRAPLPPRAPRAPRAAVAPLPEPAPRAHASRHSDSYSYTYRESDDPAERFAYVLVNGSDESMSGFGSTADWNDVRRLHGSIEGPFLWARVGDRKYVIEDPGLLERIKEAYAPQNEIGRRQSRLGEAQSRIGEQQSKIGEAQSRIGEAQSEIGQQQAMVAERLARREARGGDTRDLERMSSQLSDQMETLSRQMERLASQMEPLSRQQGELGGQMEQLGHQMERVSQSAYRETRSLIDRAIRDGDAKPLR